MASPVFLSVRFNSSLDNLYLSAEALHLVLERSGIDEMLYQQLELVVSEGMTNAIKNTPEGIVGLDIDFSSDVLVIRILDQGAGFDISAVKEPDFQKHPASGYGVYIMNSLMDSVKYTRHDDWNMLCLTKRLDTDMLAEGEID